MNQQPYNPPIRRGRSANSRTFMIGVSVVLHAAMLAGIIAFARMPSLNFENPFAISAAEIPLHSAALPPINEDEGGKDAGAPNQGPPQNQPPAEEKVEQVEEPKVEEKKPEPEPKKEEVKPEPKKEEPKPQPKQPERKPQPQPEKEVVSPNQTKKAEPEPEPPKPTPREVARELEQKRGTFKAEQNVAGTTQARYIASESDPGGQGGPQLYRSVLIGRIAQWWTPPFTRQGEVRDCTVEFTVYSPPLAADAVNQVRTARITSVRIIQSSGDLEYDARALEAIRRVPNWPPLPDSYKKDTLVVQCRFYLIGEGN